MQTGIEYLWEADHGENLAPLTDDYDVCEDIGALMDSYARYYHKQMMREVLFDVDLKHGEGDLKQLLHDGLPNDCIMGHGDVKYCSYRQGEGNQCKQCSDYDR